MKSENPCTHLVKIDPLPLRAVIHTLAEETTDTPRKV